MANGRLKVLIVDDAQLVINRIMELLKELPSVEKVNGAVSFNQAIDCLLNNTPDLVLMDIQLPEKSGIELLVHVKKHYPMVKTIMLTNKAGLYYKAICEKEGCDHFIDKSKEFERIPMIIEAYAA
jgi:DNA-binding NarL/FixJ family response regulator